MFRKSFSALFLGALLAPFSAWATFHQIKITEIFPGSAAAPNAQYVVIQMIFNSEIQIGGQPLRIFDSAGNQLQQFIIPVNLPGTSTTQPKVLLATTEAEALFGFTADSTFAMTIPLAGGKLCYGNDDFNLPIDCVSWGNFTGDNVGVGRAFQPQSGLHLGQALKRRLNIAGDPNTLALNDDTNNSDNDFVLGLPAPVNFNEGAGVIPASTCGDNAAQGIEGCDDGNTTAGDGCNAVCNVEFCGDGAVQGIEQCDDGDGDTNDSCTNACRNPICGDGSVQAGVEECDDGNTTNADGCDQNCDFEGLAGCGNGDLNGTEECDDGNITSGDGCTSTCQDEICGDGTVNDDGVEECDDGNTTNGDGCSATCFTEECGDGVVNGTEECDDGNTFAADGCNQDCFNEVCGNGRQDFGEPCDDGNATPGDGCESDCKFTPEPEGGVCATSPTRNNFTVVWLLFAFFGVSLWVRRRARAKR